MSQACITKLGRLSRTTPHGGVQTLCLKRCKHRIVRPCTLWVMCNPLHAIKGTYALIA
jgi:hypothetical protein